MILKFNDGSDVKSIELTKDGVAIFDMNESLGSDDGHSYYHALREAEARKCVQPDTWIVFDIARTNLHFCHDCFIDRFLCVGIERDQLHCDRRIIFVVGDNSDMRNIFETTEPYKLFPILSTREEAFEHIKNAA